MVPMDSSCALASPWIPWLSQSRTWWPLERPKPVGSTAGKNLRPKMAQKGHKRYLPLIFCEHQDHHWIQRTILHHILLFGCLNCDNDRENTHNSFVLVICKITAKVHCMTRITWLGFAHFCFGVGVLALHTPLGSKTDAPEPLFFDRIKKTYVSNGLFFQLMGHTLGVLFGVD